MPARIYQPAKTAMSSGMGKTQNWVLEYSAEAPRKVDPLMGWTSSSDTKSQIRLVFPTKSAAVDYARDHGIEAVVISPKNRQPNIRKGGYAENFATNRRNSWTH